MPLPCLQSGLEGGSYTKKYWRKRKMTVYEAMKGVQGILEKLSSARIDLSNVRNIALYEEYERLRKSGEKMSYIYTHLSEKYAMNKRTVRRIIIRFTKHL